MTRNFSILLIHLFFILTTNALASGVSTRVSCYLSKIDQDYPHGAIPVIGIVEFSENEIKVPVQFYGGQQETWQSSLSPDKHGPLSGNHFWGIQIGYSDDKKINRIKVQFEPPENIGLPNEEATYLADFYCNSYIGNQSLNHTDALKIAREYIEEKFHQGIIEKESIRIRSTQEGCNDVSFYTQKTDQCLPEGNYAGLYVHFLICEGKVKKENYFCDDY